jgi:hypothetical protein
VERTGKNGPPFTTTLGVQRIRDRATNQQPAPGRRDTLGIACIAILAALLAAAWASGMSSDRPAPPGPGTVFMGLFLLFLGAMFVASYFVPNGSPVLRWLLKFASGFPGMKSPKMVFLLALVCMLSGAGAIATGLGVRLV